jgi:hypothetical protein
MLTHHGSQKIPGFRSHHAMDGWSMKRPAPITSRNGRPRQRRDPKAAMALPLW